MAWIESHQALGRHPKLLKLAGALRVHKAQAIGHLLYLWWWALDYTPTGDLSALTPAEISAACEWQGDVGKMHTALKETGWVDKTGQLHDWMDYAGKLIEQRENEREKTRARVREYRERHKNTVTALHGPCNGGTVPNPTVPNPTVPTNTKAPKTRLSVCDIEIPESLRGHTPEIRLWLTYKQERGQMYKPTGLNALWRALEGIPPAKRKESIDHSMANNWSGIFEKRGGGNGKPSAGEATPTPGKYAHLS